MNVLLRDRIPGGHSQVSHLWMWTLTLHGVRDPVPVIREIKRRRLHAFDIDPFFGFDMPAPIVHPLPSCIPAIDDQMTSRHE